MLILQKMKNKLLPHAITVQSLMAINFDKYTNVNWWYSGDKQWNRGLIPNQKRKTLRAYFHGGIIRSWKFNFKREVTGKLLCT